MLIGCQTIIAKKVWKKHFSKHYSELDFKVFHRPFKTNVDGILSKFSGSLSIAEDRFKNLWFIFNSLCEDLNKIKFLKDNIATIISHELGHYESFNDRSIKPDAAAKIFSSLIERREVTYEILEEEKLAWKYAETIYQKTKYDWKIFEKIKEKGLESYILLLK